MAKEAGSSPIKRDARAWLKELTGNEVILQNIRVFCRRILPLINSSAVVNAEQEDAFLFEFVTLVTQLDKIPSATLFAIVAAINSCR